MIILVASCASKASPEPPAAPSNLTATLEDSDVIISWQDNSDNETNFIVQWAIVGASNPGDLREITSYGENTTSWKQHPDAECGTTYQYVVQAGLSTGGLQIKYSDPVCIQLMLACDGAAREISPTPCEGGFWEYFAD
jgi:hypothetical protein